MSTSLLRLRISNSKIDVMKDLLFSKDGKKCSSKKKDICQEAQDLT